MTHGMRNTPEYQAWNGMKARCHNPNDKAFKWYGARGVIVCKKWRSSFAAFFADVGARPSRLHSIDRFPNPLGNYEPENCRWATDKQQNRNRGEFNSTITIQGVTLTVAEWCELRGLNASAVYKRIENGWDRSKAITEPIRLGRRPSSFSKFPNVSFHNKTGKFFAFTGKGKYRKYVGSFNSAEEARLHTGVEVK